MSIRRAMKCSVWFSLGNMAVFCVEQKYHIAFLYDRKKSGRTMVRPIMRDVFFLNQRSEPATMADKQVAEDLLDTLKANEANCVGMAANMIGVRKNIIVVNMGFVNMVMFNPKIIKKSGSYETEEGCLSLDGVRKCKRYQQIEVEYQDMNFKKQRQKYSGWVAQIIQHECDHLQGIVI